jgi:hypothetical protein
VAADAGGMAKGDSAVGFAEANGTYKHDVGVGSDEARRNRFWICGRLIFLAASMRDGRAFCMRDDAAAIERSVRLDRYN